MKDMVNLEYLKEKVLDRVSSHNMNVEKFKTGLKIRLEEQFNAYKPMLDELDVIITKLSSIRYFEHMFKNKYVSITDTDIDIRYHFYNVIHMSIKVQSEPVGSPSVYTYHIKFYKDNITVSIDGGGGMVANSFGFEIEEPFYTNLDTAIANVSYNKLDCGDMLALVDRLNEINTDAKDKLFNKVLSYINGLIAEYDEIKKLTK